MISKNNSSNLLINFYLTFLFTFTNIDSSLIKLKTNKNNISLNFLQNFKMSNLSFNRYNFNDSNLYNINNIFLLNKKQKIYQSEKTKTYINNLKLNFNNKTNIKKLTINKHKKLKRIKRRHSISCFSCASEEYELLYSKSDNIFSFGQPLQFDKSCDNKLDLQNFAPTIRCDSTCITVLEPQYFGGFFFYFNNKNLFRNFK